MLFPVALIFTFTSHLNSRLIYKIEKHCFRMMAQTKYDLVLLKVLATRKGPFAQYKKSKKYPWWSATFNSNTTLLTVTLLHGCFSRFFKL